MVSEMDTRLPKIGAMVYNFETRELPSNSYLNLGGPYGKFVPFIIAGDGGFGEHKQLNWTNLYLLNKLGNNIDAETGQVIDQINMEKDMEKIKNLLQRLPYELRKLLEGYETENQVEILNDLRRNVDFKIYELRREIRDLKEDMRDLKIGIREILERLDRKDIFRGY